jgi:DUF4097 and DUF4098 domain-containing protein YvlB
MIRTFETPGPASVYVELGSGSLSVDTDDTSQTVVEVEGKDADDVTVEQRGNQVVVIAPSRKSSFFGGSQELSVQITLPHDSDLATKMGSADLVSTGRLGNLRLKSGSGDVSLEVVGGDALVETGSGDVVMEAAHGSLRVKSGSGDIEVEQLHGTSLITTGSGDVELGRADREVQVKSGSGDLRLKEAHTDVALTTASGDLVVGVMHQGALAAKNVSGDIRVGIPSGIPVWTDISCVTGSVSSSLDGAGEPEDGQPFIEVRAKTVSGDIRLEQL